MDLTNPTWNEWTATEIIPEPGVSDLYVFRVNLPVKHGMEERYREILSDEELQRVERFKKEQSRLQALVGRGVLRELLSGFLGVPARDVVLRVGSHGKPEADGISFNVAHSGEMVLIAIAASGAVGVDVEQMNTTTPVLEIADRYFALKEVAEISHGRTDEEQRAAFFKLWARKESILKADGRGLSVELSSFAADDLTTVPDADGTQRTFRVHSLPVGSEYAAAVSTENLSAKPALYLYPTE
jgi:4'-phosphopantetheinyl transferase